MFLAMPAMVFVLLLDKIVNLKVLSRILCSIVVRVFDIFYFFIDKNKI